MDLIVQHERNNLLDSFGDTKASTVKPEAKVVEPPAKAENIVDFKASVNKHEVDPNEQKYDNSFTDEQIIDNMKHSEVPGMGSIYDYLSDCYKEEIGKDNPSDEELMKYFKDAIDEDGKGKNDERLTDYAQRAGFIDEKLPGMHPESFDDLHRLSEDVDDDLDMQCVNRDNLYANDGVDHDGDGYPDSQFDYGYTNNCAYCTLAYDMRQRGYDVEASASYQFTANTDEEIESWYEGGKFTKCKSRDVNQIEKEILATNPDGARGQFGIFWTVGGGHSVSYEVINGEVYIRDCQVNKKYKLKDFPYKECLAGADYMRTDNLKLTDKALVGVKNR